MQIDIIFAIAVLVVSIVLHEVAHGYMANWLGDPTARLMGRLTLNPIKHIDPVGSLLLPLFLKLVGSPILLGYAKPVPYNPYNLRGKYAEGLVAFAGPAVNIILALVFGLIIRFFSDFLDPALIQAFGIVVVYNLVLAIFNLVPIPPLDGSKVLSALCLAISPSLARAYDTFRLNFERLGMLSGTVVILLLLYVFQNPFYEFLKLIFSVLTGKAV